MRGTCVMGVLALAFFATAAEGQEGRGQWALSAGVSAGSALGASDWRMSHPTYGGGNVTWETLRGTFSHGVLLQGNLELRRKRLGIRAAAGFLPQEFTQESPAQAKELALLMGGLAVAVYPLAGSPARLEPWLSVGAGGQKATGDLDNTGYYLSGGLGVCTRVTARVSLEGSVELRYFKYTQMDLGTDIQKDLTARPVLLSLGVRVGR